MKKVIVTLALALVCMTNANAQFGKLKGLANKVKSAASSMASSGESSVLPSTETGNIVDSNPYKKKSAANDIPLEKITKSNTAEEALGSAIARVLMMENAVKNNDESIMYHSYRNAESFIDSLRIQLKKSQVKYVDNNNRNQVDDAIAYWSEYSANVYKYQKDLLGNIRYDVTVSYDDAMEYLKKIEAEPSALKKCLMFDLISDKMLTSYMNDYDDILKVPENRFRKVSTTNATKDKEYTALCEKVLASTRSSWQAYGKDLVVVNNAEMTRRYEIALNQEKAAEYEKADQKKPVTMDGMLKLSQSTMDANLKQQIIACAKSKFGNQYVDILVDKDWNWINKYDEIFKTTVVWRALWVYVVTKENGGKLYAHQTRIRQRKQDNVFGNPYFELDDYLMRIDYK